MPFIIPEKRDLIDNWGFMPVEPGDRCYPFYKAMVEEWRAKPGWTTAHNIFQKMKEIRMWRDAFLKGDTAHEDEMVAYELAWQVFFQLYVMPYELKKREENGDI